MKRRIIYISGGERSGKSGFAQRMAEELSDSPIYLATAKCWDDDFRQRIDRHRAARGDSWSTIEEERYISKHALAGRVVMMDCVTLWLTNIFCDVEYDGDAALKIAREEWSRFVEQDFTLIVVSNEIGQGVIPMERSTRQFVDLQGSMNQYIASLSDEAYTLISGIPLKLK
ncbi:MAG: bifunctional adenosylcobinamide kinase/adenosylcobinamide-phosphate guanylyltransferase [Rikenellaceae bacterium]